MKRRRIHLEWEGQALVAKMLGTLGTLGILSLFLGNYGHFSRVPKDANGTLEVQFLVRRSWFLVDVVEVVDCLASASTSTLTADETEKFEKMVAELADKVNSLEMMRLTTSNHVRQLAE